MRADVAERVRKRRGRDHHARRRVRPSNNGRYRLPQRVSEGGSRAEGHWLGGPKSHHDDVPVVEHLLGYQLWERREALTGETRPTHADRVRDNQLTCRSRGLKTQTRRVNQTGSSPGPSACGVRAFQ